MSVTITEERTEGIQKIVFSWVSAADGTASGTTTYSYSGQCASLVTVPSSVAAPTDNYDITITDEAGLDVLAGAGANRDTSDTEYLLSSSLGSVANDKLTLNVSNAGDTKGGTVYLFFSSAAPTTYVHVGLLKAYLGISGSGDDVLLSDLIARAKAAIDRYTGRSFSATTATRYYDSGALDPDGYTLWLDDDLLSITALTNGDEEGTAIPSSEYWPMDRNAGPPYYAIRLKSGSSYQWEWDTDCWVSVTGAWGYSITAPDDIIHACIRLASYYYRQKDAQVFDVTAMPEMGQIVIPKGMPEDVRLILQPYRRIVL